MILQVLVAMLAGCNGTSNKSSSLSSQASPASAYAWMGRTASQSPQFLSGFAKHRK